MWRFLLIIYQLIFSFLLRQIPNQGVKGRVKDNMQTGTALQRWLQMPVTPPEGQAKADCLGRGADEEVSDSGLKQGHAPRHTGGPGGPKVCLVQARQAGALQKHASPFPLCVSLHIWRTQVLS